LQTKLRNIPDGDLFDSSLSLSNENLFLIKYGLSKFNKKSMEKSKIFALMG
jgi:tRNA A-37 threonylcarbamoyl transferase component Bud32